MKKLRKNVRQFFRVRKSTNLTAVALSIVAGTIFWFFNALNKDYSTNIKYPVEFLYDSESFIPVKALPRHILINVRGVGWNLLRKSLGFKVEPLRIPLENPVEVKKIPGSVVPGMIGDQLKELQLNFVLTDTLFLDIDELITRPFAIHVDSLSANLEANHIISGPIKVTPDTILLSGPSSLISKLSNHLEVTIPGKEIDSDYEEDIEVDVPNPGLVRRDPPTITVSFSLAELSDRELLLPLDAKRLQSLNIATNAKDSVIIIRFKYPKEMETPASDEFTLSVVRNSPLTNDSTLLVKLSMYPYLCVPDQRDTLLIHLRK